MILSLYFIVLVSCVYSAGSNSIQQINEKPPHGHQRNAFLQSKDSVREFVSNKNDVFNKGSFIKKLHKNADLKRLENVLHQLLEAAASPVRNEKRETKIVKQRCDKHKVEKEPAWTKWNEWSSCSVSCGKGRQIRWRHCLSDCSGIETEMEEKTCQLPACGGKLFGFINL